MTILKYTTLLFLLGSLPFFAQAQDYYIQKDDAGLNTAPYQDSLEQHAKDLVFAIPEGPLRDAFRVYGFGFYQHSEVTDGYPAAFEKMRTQIASETPYYLIFGKQTDEKGVYMRFWVDVKLPEGGAFCISNLQRELLIQNLDKFAYDTYINIPNGYVKMGIALMDSLKVKILLMLNCCLNNNNNFECLDCPENENVRTYLRVNHFYPNDTFELLQPVSSKVIQNQDFLLSNHDFVNRLLKIHGKEYDLFDGYSTRVSSWKSIDFPIKMIITTNRHFCSDTIQIAKDIWQSSKSVFWIHLLLENGKNKGQIYIKNKGLGINVVDLDASCLKICSTEVSRYSTMTSEHVHLGYTIERMTNLRYLPYFFGLGYIIFQV